MVYIKRRVLILLPLILLLVTNVSARSFKGSATINLGSFEDFYLRVITSEEELYAEPGETIEFKMYVRRGTMERVAYEVEVMDDPDDPFILDIEPKVIEQVRNIDQVPIIAKLTIPADTAPGEYPLRLNVKGKDFIEASYPMDTIINVGSRAYLFNYVYITVALILVGILIWRKKNLKNLGK